MIPFWLWKLYIITGPSVRGLIWGFVILFGAALVLGFAFGCRVIFGQVRRPVWRVVQIIILLGVIAGTAFYAALAMNFA